MCGLPPDVATQVVAARAHLGRFESVDDVIAFGQVADEHAAGLRDRGLVIRDR